MTVYRTPSDAQIREAVRRIPTKQLRRAFFEGLKNPLWIEPLAKEGVFNNPPEPEVTDDGLTRDVYWPEIVYLTRVAGESPAAVVDVLLKLGKSSNAWLRRGVFEIGARIPADQAARLQPLIRSWQSGGLGWRTDETDLVAYAVNLLRGGQREVGLWFANLIFKPSQAEHRRKPTVGLGDYWYVQGLPRVVEVLEPGDLGLVLSWLVAFERAVGHLTKKFDMTYYLRDSIRQATDTVYEVERVLIDSVRDLAVEAMLVDAAAAKNVLLKSNMLLARKIALFSLGEALSRLDVGENKSRLLTVAHDLLSDEASIDDPCRIDYAELARAVARTTGEPLALLSQVIDVGPRVDGERIRDWVRNGASDEAEVDERVKEYIDHWKHRWLAALGTEALPVELQSQLAELDIRYGVIAGPLVPTNRVDSWTGPNSPLSQDEMAAMPPAELVAHLESWHDAGDKWGPKPSHEGQGRELRGLITTNPTALVGVEHLDTRLRPTYLRAILEGWEAAIKADLSLDWGQVTSLIGGVLAHGDASDFPVEGDGRWDDDINLRPAKRAAVGLLKELAQRRASPVVPDDAMARFAEMLISAAADETAWNEYHGSEGWMDALTTSLNWQWPTRVRGLIHLMSHGKDTFWYNAARSALDSELARDDAQGASRAVLGEGIGRLIDVDADWVTRQVPNWFGTEAELTRAQQIALTTAVAVHQYHPKLYELLTPAMIAAIGSAEPIVAGWKNHSDPLQRIGEWVINAIIRGHVTVDDPVARKFFGGASARVRGEAIGHIAWNFMHAQIVEDEIRDRFAELWDQRVAHVRENPEDKEELNGFCWFVKSNKFAVEWWLPRLKEAADLGVELSTERFMIGKEIALAADIDPRGALDVLKLLLEDPDEGMTSYALTRNAVPMVIARAIASGAGALRQDGIEFMHRLGEKGNLGLEAEVNKVLDGSIAQGDVDG